MHELPEELLDAIDALSPDQMKTLSTYVGCMLRSAEKYAPKKKGPKPGSKNKPKPDAPRLPLEDTPEDMGIQERT